MLNKMIAINILITYYKNISTYLLYFFFPTKHDLLLKIVRYCELQNHSLNIHLALGKV